MLCASDLYALVGAEQAFGLRLDVVSGPAISTSAAIDRVHRLRGAEAFNVMDLDSVPAFREVLRRTLNL